jgi:hypothetical protein
MFTNAGHDILQRPPLGRVVEHVAQRDERQSDRVGQGRGVCEATRVVAAVEMMRREIGAAPEIRRDPFDKSMMGGECGRRLSILGGQDNDDLPIAVRCDIGIIEMAFALRRAPPAAGQQAREAAVGGTILRIGEQARAVAQIEADADDEPDTDGLRRLMRPHQPGDGVAVGDRDCRKAERRRGQHQFVRVRGAAQK